MTTDTSPHYLKGEERCKLYSPSPKSGHNLWVNPGAERIAHVVVPRYYIAKLVDVALLERAVYPTQLGLEGEMRANSVYQDTDHAHWCLLARATEYPPPHTKGRPYNDKHPFMNRMRKEIAINIFERRMDKRPASFNPKVRVR